MGSGHSARSPPPTSDMPTFALSPVSHSGEGRGDPRSQCSLSPYSLITAPICPVVTCCPFGYSSFGRILSGYGKSGNTYRSLGTVRGE